MHTFSKLAIAAAIVWGLPLQAPARALPHSSLDTRDDRCVSEPCEDTFPRLVRGVEVVPESFDALSKRDYIVERTPGFTAPHLAGGKPKGSGDGAGAGTGAGAGAGEGSGGKPGNPEDAPTRLGTGNGGESGGSGGGGNSPPRINPAGDSTPDTRTPERKAVDEYNAKIPETSLGASKPGDPGVEDQKGPPPDLAKFEEKGPRVDRETHDAFQRPRDPDMPAKFKDNYEVNFRSQKSEKFIADDKDLETAVNELNLNFGRAKFIRSQVRSKNPGPDNKPMADGRYIAKDGVIIGEARFNDRDRNPQGAKLNPSDITFSEWKDITASSNKPMNGLRAFVGRNIQNSGTLAAMQKGQRETGVQLDKDTVFKRGETGANEDETKAKQGAFDRMLGTDFISSINYMLKDHANDLGKKEIKEIRCYPRTYDPATDSGQKKVTIALTFGTP